MKGSFRPARPWRVLRRSTQALAIFAIVVSPFLGGWQRLERNDLSSWLRPRTELPALLRERLPRGDAAGAAHENNRLIGGGIAVDYFGVPAIDPVAGAVTLMARPSTARALVALCLPVLLALVAGRVFCGWFCPFGTLSRMLEWLLDFVPRRPRFAIPARRPVRFAILAAGLAAGLFGAHVVLYLTLPHLLVQQTVYSAWLLGGGGAALGLLAGLLVAGALVGPTTYCATLCPTGALLRLFGHRKTVRLRIAEPASCGKTCRRCSLSCWLQLDPASGDPGPDCDLCARCEPQCPKTNLRIGLGRGPLKKGSAVLALCALASSAAPAEAQGRASLQPRLVLAAERVVGGVTVAVDVVDQTGVRLASDSDEALWGIDVSVFLSRGERPPPDERGLYQPREVYEGPLRVRLSHRGRVEVLEFEGPSHPRSTPRRSIFRRRVPMRFSAGDELVVEAVDGWLPRAQRFEAPSEGVSGSIGNTLLFFFLGLASFLGLSMLALSVPPREAARAES